jgi:hypothetical protein
MARKSRSSKFDRCVKSVRRTVKARKGSSKESAAIAICTKSVLHPRGRTLKRYRRGKLTTQRKFRGGEDVELTAVKIIEKLMAVPRPPYMETKTVQVPEAKGSPAVDDMIRRLQELHASKSLFKRVGQAIARQGLPGETSMLVDSLKRMKETGVYTLSHDADFEKLRNLYPMM